jgi:hypothetical protein
MFIIKNSRLLQFFLSTQLLCSRNFGQMETLQIVLIQVGEIWGNQQKLILCRHSTRAGGMGGGVGSLLVSRYLGGQFYLALPG